MLGTSATGAKHIVRFYWFKWDQSACSTASTDAYSDTFNPTTWVQCYTEAQAPNNGAADDAKYFKVRFVASDTSVTPSGTGAISFDDVRLVTGPADVYNNHAEYHSGGSVAVKWECPSAQVVWVEAIGGGAGGSSTANYAGGGGGEYAAGYFGASAAAYAVVAGAAGSTGATGGNGSASSFNSTTVVANGGTSAGTSTTGGAGGTGGTGVITINGADGVDNANGAHGGHAARGGGGGEGTSSGTVAASVPGGGGGGDQAGTAAARGMVKIWFNA